MNIKELHMDQQIIIFVFQSLIQSTRVQLYLSNFNILWPLLQQDNTGGSRSNKTAFLFCLYSFYRYNKKYQLGMNSDFFFCKSYQIRISQLIYITYHLWNINKWKSKVILILDMNFEQRQFGIVLLVHVPFVPLSIYTCTCCSLCFPPPI